MPVQCFFGEPDVRKVLGGKDFWRPPESRESAAGEA